ncbi:hypothetical protein IED13_00970 [Bosea sp. SSUT16]|uniref:Uncharacterized protein n=1 Tax=Bosea spartocytisi TaxID=2773451 RepID=A0A927E6L5_9HYPH|nr:hypothetical protein [Bosea spartocytisi]MBD3844250.1 hypothetical protein [Bosea spartocytisi]MCT4470642.1 hypothetical protein [Bosea spartocytisi]
MNIISFDRLQKARQQKALRDEQAFIEACERELESRPQDMAELIERAKARARDRERGQ